MEHHPTLPPSSFPKLKQCACYKADHGGLAAERGTLRHQALGHVFEGDPDATGGLTPQEREGVTWAADYIRTIKTDGEPIMFERHLSVYCTFGTADAITFGTADAIAGPDLFDLKWADADYDEQMMCYALGWMQESGRTSITVHVLFALEKRVRKFTVDYEEAHRRVEVIWRAATNPDRKPTPNDCCSYCAHRLTCPALAERVETVKSGREDWALENYHISQIHEPAEMAKALALARQIADWCESVEWHAKKMAREGYELPGFKVIEKSGKAECTDIAQAFQLCGLPQEKFLSCCSVVYGRIEDAYAEHNQIPKASAKQAIAERLTPVTQRRPNTYELRKEKK
jgi:hypothetical protein